MTKEEAIEKVREMKLSPGKDAELIIALHTLIPELRESEDERIRKVIYKLLLVMRNEIFTSQDEIVTKDKALAYLEKQKEQKPAEWNANDKAFIKDCANILVANDYATSAERLLSMFPVKPAEWSEKDKHNLNSVINLVHATTDGAWGSVIGVQIENWLKNLPERFVLQPKQEWSEEDEKILHAIELHVGQLDSGETINGFSSSDMLRVLKSLRPQPQGVYKQIVHSIYKMLKGKDFYGMPTSNCISLLNDIRVKCKDADECAEILDEPSQKPSEEQMDRLFSIIAALRKDYCDDMADFLANLYAGLKKLK